MIVLYLILICIISQLTPNATALGFDTGSYDVYGGDGSAPAGIEDLLKTALGIVEMIAGLVATITLIVLGISFMKESPQGKAESKKRAFTILIGCLLVFFATEIVKFVATTANSWK